MTITEQLEELVDHTFDHDLDDDYDHECPACGSPEAVILGTLGRRQHLRCRDCGIGYSREV